MGTFVFPGPEVQKLVDSARAAQSWRPIYGEAIGRTGPALWLVKDDGVYLMSNAEVAQPAPKRLPVVYAEGFPPPLESKLGFDAQWDKQQEAAGGDDFGELIEFDDWPYLTVFHVVEIKMDEEQLVLSIGTWQVRRPGDLPL